MFNNDLEDKISYYHEIEAGTSLNTVVNSGFYRLTYNHTNTPRDVDIDSDWALMIVSRGQDTIAQFLISIQGLDENLSGIYKANVAVRSGSPSECGGTGEWSKWNRLIDNDIFSKLESRVYNLENMIE